MRSLHTRPKSAKSRSHTRSKTLRQVSSAASTGKRGGIGPLFKLYYATLRRSPTGAYGVDFFDFPGCVSAGDTPDEALAGAHEALDLHVRGMAQDGLAIPSPTPLDVVKQRVAEQDDQDGIHDAISQERVAVAVPRDLDPRRRINIILPESLLASVDGYAEAHGESRSAMLARAARERMER